MWCHQALSSNDKTMALVILLVGPAQTALQPITMNPRSCSLTRHTRLQRGFSLLELAVVLAVLGFLAALFLPITNTLMDNNRRSETRAKLDALEASLARFVMTTRRLPCPADGALPPTDANHGRESAGTGICTSNELLNGVVPWRTLAIPQDAATDAWGSLVSYRVWAGSATNPLTPAGGMDMSTLDPSSGSVVANWLVSRGFRPCNASPCAVGSAAELASKVSGNGIAYFLISHGANKWGAFNASGNLITTANGPGPGTLENINRNGVALRTTSPADFYIDTELNDNPASYFDDIVLRPTVIKVALDAGLGPRVP